MSKIRDQVLAALAKFQPKAVDVPALGGTIYVRPLTVVGMARVHAAQAKGADGSPAVSPERAPTLMMIDCIVDESGEPIFSPSDEASVSSLPGNIASQLLEAIEEVSDLNSNGTKTATGN